jgi:hypothetical protein
MIEKVEDLGLGDKLTSEETDQILKEKLGLTLADMAGALQTYTQDHAAELAANYIIIIPHGDYGCLIDDPNKITLFILEEASKPESWKAKTLRLHNDKKQPPMLKITFANKAVDEGDSMEGYVFVSFAGKILHAFVQGDP